MSETWVHVNNKKKKKKPGHGERDDDAYASKKICMYWEKSGRCMNRSGCQYAHPPICKSWKQSGCCIKAPDDCSGIHPIICSVWKTKGFCLCSSQRYFWHPVVCKNNTSCTNNSCRFFHAEVDEKPPENLLYMKRYCKKNIKQIVADSSYSVIDADMISFLNVQTCLFDFFLDEVIKTRRTTLFDSVAANCRFLIKTLSKSGDYSPYNTLVWGYSSRDNDIEAIKYILDKLIKFGFKLLTGNKKYVNENVYKTLQHPDNALPDSDKHALIRYCMHEVGDEEYWFSVFKTQLNKVVDFSSIDAIVFSLSKCYKKATEFYVRQFMCKPVKINGSKSDIVEIYRSVFDIIFNPERVPSQDESEFKMYFDTMSMEDLKSSIRELTLTNILSWRDLVSKKSAGLGVDHIDTSHAMCRILGWLYLSTDDAPARQRVRDIILSDKALLGRHFVTWAKSSGGDANVRDVMVKVYEDHGRREALQPVDDILIRNWFSDNGVS